MRLSKGGRPWTSSGRTALSVAQRFQIAFAVNRGHAACAGGRDCLPVNMVLNVASRKNSRNAGAHPAIRLNIPGRVQVQLAFEQLSIRRMADGHKHASAGRFAHYPACEIPESY